MSFLVYKKNILAGKLKKLTNSFQKFSKTKRDLSSILPFFFFKNFYESSLFIKEQKK